MRTKSRKHSDNGTSCKIESIVTIDERGQMVLPKDLRDRAGLRAGDKLAVTSWERDGRVCCITLVNADNLLDMVKAEMAPVMKEIIE